MMRLNRLSYFLLLILILTVTSTQNSYGQTKKDKPIKLDTFIVNVQASVTDPYGRNVAGLKAENFEIYDNGIKQELAHFSDVGAPIRLGIVFDTTGSMSEKVQHAKTALKRLLNSGHPEDRSFLICIRESRAFLAHDYTFDPDQIINALTLAETKGTTALYDAVYLAIEKVQEKASQDGGDKEKKVIIVISDGQDNSSRYTYKELRERIKESGALIYSIGIIKPGEELGLAGRSILEDIARMSGGRPFFPAFSFLNNPLQQANDNGLDEELGDICWRIALELRNQYSLGYYPSNLQHDGKSHKITVKIVNAPKGLPKLHLQFRNKYKDDKKD